MDYLTMTKYDRWNRRKRKHRADHNHGKSGWVGGNVRYQRRHADVLGNRTMGKARCSVW